MSSSTTADGTLGREHLGDQRAKDVGEGAADRQGRDVLAQATDAG